MIAIIDIDMGNLRSVTNALSATGNEAVVLRDPVGLHDASRVILPGVGAFAVAMQHIVDRGLLGPLREFAGSGRPILGICLGMQLLASAGDEGGPSEGMALIPGHVRRIDPSRVPTVPHVGWNDVRLRRPHPVFARVKPGIDFYHVHSFSFHAHAADDVLGTVTYGDEELTSVIGRDNVLGVQFHPEKSQASGLRILENFCDWDGAC